jgi:hypothetical protein
MLAGLGHRNQRRIHPRTTEQTAGQQHQITNRRYGEQRSGTADRAMAAPG